MNIFSYIISVTLLVVCSSNTYATLGSKSELEQDKLSSPFGNSLGKEEDNPGKESFSSSSPLDILKPSDLYGGEFEDLVEGEHKKIISGVVAAENDDEKFALYSEGAKKNNTFHMYKLGEIREQEGKLKEALEWYILSFEKEWLDNSKHSDRVKRKFDQWLEKYRHISQKAQTSKKKKKKENVEFRVYNPLSNEMHRLHQVENFLLLLNDSGTNGFYT